MKSEIIHDLTEIIIKEEKKFNKDATLNSFKEASKRFDKLVEEGIVEKRGYNLMTIEKKHLYQYSINS